LFTPALLSRAKLNGGSEAVVAVAGARLGAFAAIDRFLRFFEKLWFELVKGLVPVGLFTPLFIGNSFLFRILALVSIGRKPSNKVLKLTRPCGTQCLNR